MTNITTTGATFHFEYRADLDLYYFICDGSPYLIASHLKTFFNAPNFETEDFVEYIEEKVERLTGVKLLREVIEEDVYALASDIYGIND